MKKGAWFAIVAACCVACSGSSSQTRTDGTGAESGAAESGETGTKKASKRAGKLQFDGASPRAVSVVAFRGNRLAVGFSDGNIALVHPKSGEIESASVAEVFAVDAVAPHGDLALLAKNPPVVVNFDGELILQMNTVSEYESAAFSKGGLPLYVADRNGKVRIWGQSHSFEKDQHKEKLENYLNRQAPDFHVELTPIRGPIHVMDDGRLVIVDEAGVVKLWDPTRPSKSKRIMKLDGTARSIDSAEGHIYATSVTGGLKVGKAEGAYLPWSAEARGDYVAATPLAAGHFFLQQAGSLSQRATETGEEVWTAEVPDGHACGLDISDDGDWLAACIGNYVALFDASTGEAVSYVYRSADGLVWKSASGKKLN